MKFIHILVLTLALAAPALCYPSGSSGASDGEIPFGSVAAVSEVQQDKPEDFVQPPAPDPSEAQSSPPQALAEKPEAGMRPSRPAGARPTR